MAHHESKENPPVFTQRLSNANMLCLTGSQRKIVMKMRFVGPNVLNNDFKEKVATVLHSRTWLETTQENLRHCVKNESLFEQKKKHKTSQALFEHSTGNPRKWTLHQVRKKEKLQDVRPMTMNAGKDLLQFHFKHLNANQPRLLPNYLR